MVENLAPNGEGAGDAFVLLNSLPPRRDGVRHVGVGIERLEEVDEYGPLDGGEVSIPNEIKGDVAFEEWAVVVLENQRLLLNK